MAVPGLIVLGSGTAVPRAGRTTSCYLLDDGAGSAYLVDLGPGCLQRAAAAGYPLERLAAVLLTHVHPDHSADLVALQFVLRLGLVRRGLPPLPVLGHPDVRLLASRLRNAWPGWLGVGEDRLRFVDAAPGELLLPGATRARAFRVAHIPSSLGYRFELPNGASIAFSGDVTEGEELAELARDVDVLVLEAAAPSSAPVAGHLTPERAGRVAAAAGVRHLVLTHFYPATLECPIEEEARRTFEGRLTLAQDGALLPLEARSCS